MDVTISITHLEFTSSELEGKIINDDLSDLEADLPIFSRHEHSPEEGEKMVPNGPIFLVHFPGQPCEFFGGPKSGQLVDIWMFPKIGVPPNHPF